MNNTTQTFGSLAGNLNFTNHTKTLTLGGNNLSTVYSGVISGCDDYLSRRLIKIGTGTQTFSGSNTYTGPTQINGGTLLIGTGTATTSAVDPREQQCHWSATERPTSALSAATGPSAGR